MFAYAEMEKEQNAYEILDLEPTEFKLLLDFFYTGEIPKFDYNLQGILDIKKMLRAATTYGAMEVVDCCVNELQLKFTENIDNSSSLLSLAVEIENAKLEKVMIDFICKPENASNIFGPSFQFFNDFTEKALLKLLPLDELAVNEVQLFETIVSWGKTQLPNLGPKNQTLRSILDNLIPYIRFTLIPPTDFTRIVEPTGLLTMVEQIIIYKFYMSDEESRASYNAGIFNTKPRRNQLHVNSSLVPKTSLSTPVNLNGQLKQISFDGRSLVALTNSDEIYMTEKESVIKGNPKWKKLDGIKLKQVEVFGSLIYGVNGDGDLYVWNASESSPYWNKLHAVKLKQISFDGEKLAGVNTEGEIYVADTKLFTAPNFRRLYIRSGFTKQIVVGRRGRLYGLYVDDFVFVLFACGSTWGQTSINLRQISCDGTHLVGVNSHNEVYLALTQAGYVFLTDGRKLPGDFKQVVVFGDILYGISSSNHNLYAGTTTGPNAPDWKEINCDN